VGSLFFERERKRKLRQRKAKGGSKERSQKKFVLMKNRAKRKVLKVTKNEVLSLQKMEEGPSHSN